MGYARRVKRFGLLFQAVGFRAGRPSVLDATAGLGRDAFRLAYHGCNVTAVERCPAVFALLRDGLERAERDPEVSQRLGGRMQMVQGEACDVLRTLSADETPEVVYLDPMFPPKRKSALVKKEMRVLRRLVGDDLDAGELFEAARTAARKRVVVKRLRQAEPLAPNPTHSLCDRTARYDVYVRRE
jgi:16S rRNA (guanine1516-N2)-methyltransferase